MLKNLFTAYHLPKDKDTYALEQMNNRKQKVGEDVSKYITHKHLLCLEVNNAMPFDEIKRHVLDGMSPDVKATSVHKENPNMDRLIENARNIEQGLRLLPNYNAQNEYKERLIATENSVKALCEGMAKLLTKVSETDKPFENKNRDRSRDNYRRDDRRRDDRRNADRSFSRDRYSNGAYNRDQSRERFDNRNYYREPSVERRDNFDRRQTERRNFDNNDRYRNRSNSRDRTQRNDSYDRNRNYNNERKIDFDLARNVSNTRNLEGEPICYLCNKPGHHAKFCPKNQFGRTPPPKRKAYFINSGFSDIESDDDGLIYQKVNVEGMSVSALIDCGSVVSLIESKIAKSLKLPIKPYTGRDVKRLTVPQLLSLVRLRYQSI